MTLPCEIYKNNLKKEFEFRHLAKPIHNETYIDYYFDVKIFSENLSHEAIEGYQKDINKYKESLGLSKDIPLSVYVAENGTAKGGYIKLDTLKIIYLCFKIKSDEIFEEFRKELTVNTSKQKKLLKYVKDILDKINEKEDIIGYFFSDLPEDLFEHVYKGARPHFRQNPR